MIEYKIKIAGVVIEVSNLYPYTKAFCAGYETDEAPDFFITTSQDDIELERKMADREAIIEGIPLMNFPDDYLESIASYRKIAIKMLAYDAAVFHGAAVAVDGQTYLFTAQSGTGKTTHMRLWLEKFRERALVVNGDKPILRFDGQRILVCGTPWSGKERLNTNIMLPLKALCILERAKENRIVPITLQEAMTTLFQQIYRPNAREDMRQTMQMVRRLGQYSALYRLGCNMEKEAAAVAYLGMNQ